ncbi:tetratricopeptide repeat protein [Cognataquiflexum rubidum]|uniref:tetratricopeptide repeat protein n=1 Tax=Cognataquiflexum rubidum TaxID=2922273 RepID=UPI001F1311CE|nr:tetratricopeptide repeat protein [Cognataquiflexum rubidum]MCH6234499.1 tetratricopeptide repeat protein [Cognataquiflexum rubidum]
MQVIYQRSEFLKKLFPAIDIHDNDQLIRVLKEFYSVGQLSADVKISEDTIEINVPDAPLGGDPAAFQKANKLCEHGRFSEARPILEELISKYPPVSEYHRTLAQSYEEEGNHEKAIDILIDALKWDPKNHWALILMGNIYFRYYNDLNVAMTYFDQVVESDPKNYIALNNIGGTFLQAGKLTLAERYLGKAYKANPKFPNITLGMGLLNFQKGDFRSAFDFSIQALRFEQKLESQVYKTALKLALDSSDTLIEKQTGKESLIDFIQEIEKLTGKEVVIEQDSTISTAAKVEFAENHHRDFHKILHNPKYPQTDHLIAHELVHLKLAEEARKKKCNKLFIGKDSKIETFRKGIQSTLKKLEKRGVSPENIDKYAKSLFDGILSQVYNTAIDLFIEDFLYNQYPELRYIQFRSLYQMNQEGHKAVNDPKIIELSPPDILTKSRIFNVVSARHFEDLFGVKMEKQYALRPFEKDQADLFWDEFKEYRSDRKEGEEYELVQHWGEDLELGSFFELVDEIEYRSQNQPSSKSPEDVLTQIEQDPMQLNSFDLEEEESLKKFQEEHAGKDINMAVAMYMVGALEHFRGMSNDKVKEIAYEIAMLGQTGISPEKKGYKLNKIPNTTFTGYKLLAYYYVSWAIAIPEMLRELQMPFDKEYQLALTLSK